MKVKKGGKKGAFWEGSAGWKAVDVGEELLLGSDEFGFAGLEQLDPSMLGQALGGMPAGDTAPAADAVPHQQPAHGRKKKEKQKGRKKRKQPEEGGTAAAEGEGEGEGGQGGDESLEALKAKIAKLESENKQLKGKKEKRKERRDRKRNKKGQAAGEVAGEGAGEGNGEPAATQQLAGQAASKKGGKGGKGAANAKQAAAQQQQQKQRKEEPELPSVDVSAWKVFQLHPLVERAVGRLGFSTPTHVQSECIPAAVRDRRDVIGAAQTGSGKTLAFGLPIMQLLLQEREREQAQQQEEGEGGGEEQKGGKLRALILAPTRELAMQVCEHLQAVGRVCGIWVVPIVGGISAQKQERMLSKNPQVIVATPGRLWDLMKTGQAHVTDLSRLSFLVIDEADRMVQQGHYQELTDILGAIPQPATQQEAVEEAVAAEARRRLPKAAAVEAGGAEGEEDEEEEEEGGAGGSSGDEGAADADMAAAAAADGEEEREDEEEEGGEEDAAAAAAAAEEEEQQPRRRRRHLMQTFVFSATLTLPSNLRKRLRKGGGGATGSASLDSLMDRIPFRPKPKIVDLTSQRKLADKVEEAYLECGEGERDEYLYCILAKHPGRTLVFVNAISSVRRLGAILKLLGLPVHPLHAGMQQRARLKALDRFKSSPNAILVATDVAARGLDVKDVRCVIHYQIPASVDVYVHRSGRTARAEAEGISIALVTPKESARFLALLRALKREPPPEFPVDLSLMPAAHKRVRLAVRLDEISRKQSKENADLSWKRQNAEAVGIILSEESEDEEAFQAKRVGKRARRDKSGERGPDEDATAEELKAQLSTLLAEPLQPSFSRKFFTGGAAAAVAAHLGAAAPAAGDGKWKGQKAGAGGAAEGGAGDEPAGQALADTAATVTGAVALARSMAASRAQAAADIKQKTAKQQQKKKKKKANTAAADPRAAALKAALAQHGAKKRGGGGRGLFVIPQAFGRDVAGPDALQALRSKLAKL